MSMLLTVCPKLPMRNKAATLEFYVNKLGFQKLGSADYDDYLMLLKDNIEIHFFLFNELDPRQNYGQVYIRTDDINSWYQTATEKSIDMPTARHLQVKPRGQKEFSLLDPDNNLLTFGQNAV